MLWTASLNDIYIYVHVYNRSIHTVISINVHIYVKSINAVTSMKISGGVKQVLWAQTPLPLKDLYIKDR
jgi:hypothetical protein